MVKGVQNLAADLTQVIDQLERHCLAPDGSLVSKSAYCVLQLAREEISKERLRYLEAKPWEVMVMVEEYQQAVSMTNLRGSRDLHGLNNSPQLYETLEHRMTVQKRLKG